MYLPTRIVSTACYLGFMFLVLASGSSPVWAAESFFYADVMHPLKPYAVAGATFTVDQDQGIVAFGDVAEHATFCDGSDGFVCFTSKKLIKFSAKRPVVVGDKWRRDGVKYEAVERIRSPILGLKEPFVVIHSKQAGTTIRFIFSNDLGLIAFGAASGMSFYTSVSPCGFGAVSPCVNQR